MRASAGRASLILFAGLVVGLVLGAACAQQAPEPTQIKIFKPFDPGGGLVVGLAVTSEVRGSCWTSSLAAQGRPDAWRCMSGNTIYDPCFAPFGGNRLACAEEPWSANAVLLTLSAPLPEGAGGEGEPLEGLPWALELDNGRRCTLLTGATTAVAGLRLDYGCDGDSYVVGEPDRSLPRWRVFYGTERRSLALEQVGVVAAWY